MKSRTKIILGLSLVVVTLGVTFFVCTNYYLVHDTLRSWSYSPTPEVASIKEKLDLTDTGDLIFKSTSPALDGSQDFNTHCQSYDQSVTILGCYSDSSIYVYNIKDKDLDGIIEATVAHEMMHAIWARLSEDERRTISEDLDTVYKKNRDALSIVEDYNSASKYDELFARVGTEIRNIPDRLEKVYARYFNNRRAIVKMYEGYRRVFDELSSEAETLSNEIEALKSEIAADTASYKQRAAEFSSAVKEFNDCANNSGCFGSQYSFNSRRAALIEEQESLDAFYDQIVDEVNECNRKIEAYNNNVLKTSQYAETINSNIQRVEKQ